MTTKQGFDLSVVQAAAEVITHVLRPFCDRLEIAGSVRRGAGTVSDLEVVLIPTSCTPSFGRPWTDHVTAFLEGAVNFPGTQWAVRHDINGVPIGRGEKNKYVQFRWPINNTDLQIPVDLFLTDNDRWGMTMFVRTGPREWNKAAATQALQRGMKLRPYEGFERNGAITRCLDETDVFDMLEWHYIEPAYRSGDIAWEMTN